MKVIPDKTKPIGKWKVIITEKEAKQIIQYMEDYLIWFEKEALPLYVKLFPKNKS